MGSGRSRPKRALPRSPPRRGAGVGGRGGAGAEPPGERVPGREPQGFRARGGAATPGEPAAPVRARPCSHAPGSLDRGRCCRAGTTEPGAETGSRCGRTTPRSAGAVRPRPPAIPAARTRGHEPRRLDRDAQQSARRAPAQSGRDRRRARRQWPPARRSAQPRRSHARRSRRGRHSRVLRRPDPAPNRIAVCDQRRAGHYGAVQGPLHALAFSSDGRTLAVGSTSGDTATAELVDARTHAPAGVFAVSPDASLTADIAFAPDGRTFATGEPLNGRMHPPPALIVSWDARTGTARAQTGPIAGGRLTGYTRDGRSLLVVSGERRSLLLDARTLKRLRTFPVGGAAALSPSADEAAFGHADGTVTLLDLASGKRKQLFGQSTAPIETISFSRDGKMLASGAADGSIGLWRVRTGVFETLHGHSASVQAGVFSPDGRTLYTASNDGSVIAWDVSGSRRLGQPFRYAAVSPDGTLFAVSPGPNRVTLWRSAARTPIRPELHGPAGKVDRLAFSPDGRLVAAAGSRHAVLWNTKTRTIVRILPAGAVAISPDSHSVAIGQDGGAVVYDIRTGKPTADFSSAHGSTQEVDFSPDGKLLASVSLDGTASIWDVARRRRRAALAGAGVLALPFGSRRTGSSSPSATAPERSFSGTSPPASTMGYRSSATAAASPPWTSTPTELAWLPPADGNLRLWDVATRRLIGAPLPGSTIAAERSISSLTESTSSACSSQERRSSGTSTPARGRLRPAVSPAATSPAPNGRSSSGAAATATSVHNGSCATSTSC